jgi:hypothetical protein
MSKWVSEWQIAATTAHAESSVITSRCKVVAANSGDSSQTDTAHLHEEDGTLDGEQTGFLLQRFSDCRNEKQTF